MKIQKSTSRALWIMTGAVFCIILLPSLFQEGMFLDGVTYSSISRNIAIGHGDFWHPHYSKTFSSVFYGHPPLVFWLQSLFYRFGDFPFYTERIYSLLMAILGGLGLTLCWNIITDKTDINRYAWLPILIWITIPIVGWGNNNNMLENTMNVFDVFSVYYYLKYFSKGRRLYFIIASLLVLLAFFSKGSVGVFPIAVPFIYYLVYKPNLKKVFVHSLMAITIPSIILRLVMVLSDSAQESMLTYIDIQLLPAVIGASETRSSSPAKRF